MKRALGGIVAAILLLTQPAAAQSMLRDAETEAMFRRMSAPLAEAAGIAATMLASPKSRVSAAQYGALWAGIARALDDSTSAMTQTSAVIGTAQYVSPEQARGETVDHRSDVYSVGCLLFELLTGQRAIEGESPIHVAFQHVHGSVPVPSERVDGLPSSLDDLVALATHRDPDARPRDAADYLAELQRVRADLTSDELDRRRREWIRPHTVALRPAGTLARRVCDSWVRTR